jgi:hypothetical protein
MLAVWQRWRARTALRMIRASGGFMIRAMTTRMFKLDRSIKTAVGGPLVGVGYYVIALAVRYIGCLPAYADADFAGIPVAQFLLLALTLAALVLTVFAALAGFRLHRQSARARSSSARKAGRWGLAGIALAAAAFAAIVAGALPMLRATCP